MIDGQQLRIEERHDHRTKPRRRRHPNPGGAAHPASAFDKPAAALHSSCSTARAFPAARGTRSSRSCPRAATSSRSTCPGTATRRDSPTGPGTPRTTWPSPSPSCSTNWASPPQTSRATAAAAGQHSNWADWVALDRDRTRTGRTVAAWRARHIRLGMRQARVNARIVRRLFPRAPRSRAGRALAAAQVAGHPFRMPYGPVHDTVHALATAPGFRETLRALEKTRFTDGAAITVPVTVAFGTRDRVLLPGIARHRRAAARPDPLGATARLRARPVARRPRHGSQPAAADRRSGDRSDSRQGNPVGPIGRRSGVTEPAAGTGARGRRRAPGREGPRGRRQHAVGAGLDEQVAQRGGLDRAGDHRAPAASAVSWHSSAFCEPPPTMWTTSMRWPDSRSASRDGGGERGGEAVQDAADDLGTGAGQRLPRSRQARRSGPACPRAAGTPGRRGRSAGHRPAGAAAAARTRRRSTSSPCRFQVRMDSDSSHRPITLRR